MYGKHEESLSLLAWLETPMMCVWVVYKVMHPGMHPGKLVSTGSEHYFLVCRLCHNGRVVSVCAPNSGPALFPGTVLLREDQGLVLVGKFPHHHI